MVTLTVPDMTCGHCVGAITQAITEVDRQAKIDCDLQAHHVNVASNASTESVRSAIEAAGYTVTDELQK